MIYVSRSSYMSTQTETQCQRVHNSRDATCCKLLVKWLHTLVSGMVSSAASR